MNSLLQRLSEKAIQPIDTVVVIGAGYASSLSTMRRLNGKRLVLVEGHTQQAKKLARSIRKDQYEELHFLAITNEQSPSIPFYPCNNPNFSSVLFPERVLITGPNLRFASPIQVPAQSFDSFISCLQLDSEANNLLVLDAPGISAKILITALPELLHLFSWIYFRDGALSGLYRSDCSAQNALDRLTTTGFKHFTKDDETLYPQTGHLLTRDQEWLVRYTLKRQLETVKSELVEAQAQADEHLILIETLSKQLDTLAQENTTLNREKNKLLQVLQEQENLSRELGNERDALIKEQSTFVEVKIALQQATEAQRGTIQNLTRQLEEIDQQRNRLKRENQTLKEENAALVQTKNAFMQSADNQLKSIQDLSLQLKNQLKQANDLHIMNLNLEHLTKDQDKRIQELTNKSNTLAEEKTALLETKSNLQQSFNNQLKSLEELSRALHVAQAHLIEKEAHLARIETHAKRQEHSQQLLQEELIKAEAQIELIKGLLVDELGA